MHFLLEGPFGELSKNLTATNTEFLPLFVNVNSQFFSRLNINIKLLQMCICDKQRYNFNRIYKYERSKY